MTISSLSLLGNRFASLTSRAVCCGALAYVVNKRVVAEPDAPPLVAWEDRFHPLRVFTVLGATSCLFALGKRIEAMIKDHSFTKMALDLDRIKKYFTGVYLESVPSSLDTMAITASVLNQVYGDPLDEPHNLAALIGWGWLAYRTADIMTTGGTTSSDLIRQNSLWLRGIRDGLCEGLYYLSISALNNELFYNTLSAFSVAAECSYIFADDPAFQKKAVIGSMILLSAISIRTDSLISFGSETFAKEVALLATISIIDALGWSAALLRTHELPEGEMVWPAIGATGTVWLAARLIQLWTFPPDWFKSVAAGDFTPFTESWNGLSRLFPDI